MSVFRTSRVLSATVTAVFDAIRDPQRLARWWGPDGFTNEFDVFEFAPGGRWQFTMVGPDGKRYRNESAFADIVPGARVRIVRDHVVAFTGEVESVRRIKEDVREVKEGFECGIKLKNYNDIAEGDQLEFFEVKEVARTL